MSDAPIYLNKDSNDVDKLLIAFLGITALGKTAVLNMINDIQRANIKREEINPTTISELCSHLNTKFHRYVSHEEIVYWAIPLYLYKLYLYKYTTYPNKVVERFEE